MNFRCTTAVSELDKTYKAIRAELERLFEEAESLKTQRTEVKADKALSSEGKAAKRDELDKRYFEIMQQIQKTSGEAALKLDKCKRSFADSAGGEFRVRPQDIDEKAVMLLNSGALSHAELLNMAQSYKRNAAMRRLIGAEILKRAEDVTIKPETASELKRAGNELTSKENPLESVLDGLHEIALMGCRPDPTTSGGVHTRLYGAALARAQEQAQQLDAEYGDPCAAE